MDSTIITASGQLVVVALLILCQFGLHNSVTVLADTPSLSDHVDRHSIFKHSLKEGVYVFDKDGYIPKAPLEKIRMIHKEMIETIQAIGDFKKRTQYLLTLSNTANKDLVELRQKIVAELGSSNITDLDKRELKADAFILITSHAALLGNAIMYFPDIMDTMIKKNPEFGEIIKWVVNLAANTDIIRDKLLLKLFNLVQQEIGIIPKGSDYVNPYKSSNRRYETTTPTTTTKKPRKKFPRGPRMTGGEL